MILAPVEELVSRRVGITRVEWYDTGKSATRSLLAVMKGSA